MYIWGKCIQKTFFSRIGRENRQWGRMILIYIYVYILIVNYIYYYRRIIWNKHMTWEWFSFFMWEVWKSEHYTTTLRGDLYYAFLQICNIRNLNSPAFLYFAYFCVLRGENWVQKDKLEAGTCVLPHPQNNPVSPEANENNFLTILNLWAERRRTYWGCCDYENIWGTLITFLDTRNAILFKLRLWGK